MVIIVAVATFVLGLLVGVVLGDNMGTRDTERRWAEAVGRAGHK